MPPSFLTRPQNEELILLVEAFKECGKYRRRRRLLLRIFWHCGRLYHRGYPPDETEGLLYHVGQELRDAVAHLHLPLEDCRDLYLAFPDVEQLSLQLTWTHYLRLLRIKDPAARAFYFREAEQNHWTTRELERQMATNYYERQLFGHDHALEGVKISALKDPYILEFINQDLVDRRQERELETALLNQLQAFLLELGKGFAFVHRQKRIVTESGKPFYIDLVFYHYILKRFVLFELKAGELTPRDIGQLDLYVRLYEEKYRRADDGPTLGVILCKEKDQTVVQYSMLQDNPQLFAATYSLYLPSKKDFDELFEHKPPPKVETDTGNQAPERLNDPRRH